MNTAVPVEQCNDLIIPYALKFRGTKFSQFSRLGRPSANSLICEYFEQVLRKFKEMDADAPLSPLYWIGSTNTDDASLDIS